MGESSIPIEPIKEEIARLRDENRRLSEQVKRLVKTENELYRMQEQLDQQIRLYHQLYEIGKQYNAARELVEILQLTIHFILYQLNFERAVILLYMAEAKRFQMQALDGYYNEALSQQVMALSLSEAEPALAALQQGAEQVICPAGCQEESLRSLGHRLGMDEYILLPLSGEAGRPVGLLAAGNTAEMAPYQTRLEPDNAFIVSLANLAGQAAIAINNVNFYQALRENEAKYRTLFEDSRDGIFITTPAGKIIEANRATQELLGYSRAELVALNAEDVYADPADRLRFRQAIEQTGSIRDFEVRLRKKDDTARDCLLTATLRRADDGRVLAYQGIVRDITERRKAQQLLEDYNRTLEQQVAERMAELSAANAILQEQITERQRAEENLAKRAAELEEARNFLDSIIDNTPIGIFVKDAEALSFVHWNKAMEELFNLKKELVLGKTDHDFFPKAEADFFTSVDRHILESRQIVDIPEEPAHTSHRGVITLHTRKASVLGADGTPRYLLGITEDITERKQAEEKLRRQNEYLAVLHDTALGLMSRLDLNELLEALISRAGQLLDTPHGFIYLVNAEEGEFERKVGLGVFSQSLSFRLKLGEGLAGKVWQSGQPLVVDDYDVWPERSPNFGYQLIQAMIGVPLKSGAQVVGVLGMAYNPESNRIFGPEEVELLNRFAQLASLALDNAQLFTQVQIAQAEAEDQAGRLSEANAALQTEVIERRRAEQVQTILYRIAEAASAAEEMQEFYRAVHKIIGGLMHANNFYIALYDQARDMINFPFFVDEVGVDIPDPHRWDKVGLGTAKGITPYVIRAGQPLLLGQEKYLELIRQGEVELLGLMPLDWLGVPLKTSGRTLGILVVQSYSEEIRYSNQDKELLTFVAQHVATALERVRLLAETRQRVVELSTVNTISQALSSQLDLNALIELVGEQIRQTFTGDIVYVALYDRETQMIHFPYEFGDQLSSIPFGQGLSSKIIESGQPLLINEAVAERHTELKATAVGIQPKSYLGVPITVGHEVIGVISVQSIEQEGRFDEPDVRLLRTIAANVGAAIQTARLYSSAQREREYFESLVQNSPVAIVTTDLDGKVTSWNPAAELLFGYSQEEANGCSLDDLVAQTEAIHEEAVHISHQGLTEGFMHAITQRTHKSGRLVDVKLSSVLVTVAGEKVGFIIIYHDITELQQARWDAEAANQAKSAFLANMSHEIRTPMNGIIGMTSLLLDTGLSPEQREFTEIIRHSSDALLTIINDILDFSKIEAGKLELESQPFDLRDCLEGALDLLAPSAAQKGLEIAYLVDDQTPAAIIGDITRLRQILVNLLSNAVKFTEQGEVVVSVNAERRMRNEELKSQSPLHHSSFIIHFSVRDTGIGIPPERMDRLFQSFSQVDASTSRRYGGTGLGLAISKRLSEMMGGTMWVESPSSIPPNGGERKGGPGAIFHFTIQAEAAGTPVRAYLYEVQPQLEGKRVLIVDDNATNRWILSLQTQSWGMLSQATASPVEALAWLRRRQPFDLAILDMQMPEMDGLALAAEIRKLETGRGAGEQGSRGDEEQANLKITASANLPLVMLTSLGGRETIQEMAAEAVEFAAFLIKPIKASQLFDVLVGIFDHQAKPSRQRTSSEASLFDAQMGQQMPLRILLAEDNTTNQKLALRLLERLGYRADLAANGLEVLDALERQPYEVILMDVQMPEMDGLETTARIRQRWSDLQSPYIIAMTANAMQGDREICLAAGMNDYVSKPIRVEELVQALRAINNEQLVTYGKAESRGAVGKSPPRREQESKGDGKNESVNTKIQNLSQRPPVGKSKIQNPIDLAALEKLREMGGGDTAFVAEMIETFLEDAPRLLADMRQALAQGDAAGLRLAAHSLKSNSADFGAMTLSGICRELEGIGKAGALIGADELISQAEAEYEGVKAALENAQKK